MIYLRSISSTPLIIILHCNII